MHLRKKAILATTVVLAIGGLGACGGSGDSDDAHDEPEVVNGKQDDEYFVSYEGSTPRAVLEAARNVASACVDNAVTTGFAGLEGVTAATPRSALAQVTDRVPDVRSTNPNVSSRQAAQNLYYDFTLKYNECVTGHVAAYDGPGIIVVDRSRDGDVVEQAQKLAWLQAHRDFTVARSATRASDSARVTISGQQPDVPREEPDAGTEQDTTSAPDETAPAPDGRSATDVDPSESMANSNLPGADRECTGLGQRELPPGTTVSDEKWPSAYTGWTVTLGTYATEAQAAKVATQAKKRGLSPVGILDGQVYCPAGGYTVFFGAHPSSDAAAGNIQAAEDAGFVGAYAVKVSR